MLFKINPYTLVLRNWSFSINLAAPFGCFSFKCTNISLCICHGFPAILLYSSVYLTNILWTVSLTLGVARWRVNLRRQSLLAHCDGMVWTLFDHYCFECIVVSR